MEKYFQSILTGWIPFLVRILRSVNLEKRGDLAAFIRGEVEFNDGSSLLSFRE